MQKTLILLVIGAVVLVGGFFLFFRGSEQGIESYEVAATFSEDTTIEGDHVIASEQKTVVQNGATLTVNGNLQVQGSLECDRGALNVVVKGDVTIDDALVCERAEDIAEDDLGMGIVLVAEGSITIGEEAVVVSNGHVQIVDSEDSILYTEDAIDEAYEEAGQDTGDIPRIGPFTAGNGVAHVPQQVSRSSYTAFVSRFGGMLGEVASAQATDEVGRPVRTVQLSGKWYVGNPGQAPPRGLNIPTPPKNVKKILLLFNFGPGAQVNLQNFTLVGPNGADGDSSVDESCSAQGEDGNDAMRFRVRASNIRVNNFTLFPGDGGDGGRAITKQDCYPKGVAAGGNGGNAGNIKMEASGTFEVQGAFIVHPGWAGNGGRAVAYARDGKDQCPGEAGGEAQATGGNGADNKKKITIQNVSGANNIQIGDMWGGDGGEATPNPGKGGNGTGSDCDGGPGGKAIAKGGKGGDASLTGGGGTGRTGGATETGGDGGDATATGANGGDGGTGSEKTPGGDGGKGGDAQPVKGAGGSATVAGNPGTEDEKGGDGGKGGDGCNEGKGGDKGLGLTLGQHGADGVDGKNLCVPPAGGTGVTPGSGTPIVPGGTTLQPPPPSGTTGGTSDGIEDETVDEPKEELASESTEEVILVIQFQGNYYIPIDQLFVVPGHKVDEFGGCEEDHWHAEGPVMTTDGMVVNDPNPNGCGFGTLSSTPVMEIPVPR